MTAKKKILKTIAAAAVIIAALAAVSVLMVNFSVKNSVEDKIIYTVTGETAYDNENISEMKALEPDCILILGAGITDKDTPSPMLKDRLDAGIQLYKEGVASKILLSGDNGQQEHNEIHVMLKYAKEAGGPEEDIFCDHAGFSTYDVQSFQHIRGREGHRSHPEISSVQGAVCRRRTGT